MKPLYRDVINKIQKLDLTEKITSNNKSPALLYESEINDLFCYFYIDTYEIKWSK